MDRRTIEGIVRLTLDFAEAHVRVRPGEMTAPRPEITILGSELNQLITHIDLHGPTSYREYVDRNLGI